MPATRGTIAVVGVLAAAAVAWALLRTRGDESDGDPAATGRSEETGDAPAERPALASGARVETPAVERTVSAAGTAEIHGVVRRKGAGEAADVAVFGVPATEGSAVPVDRLLGPLIDPKAKPVATAKSGADGTYVVAGRGPGTYAVFATAVDGRTGYALATLRAGDRVRADCEIRGAALTLRGRAVDRVGKPWRGAVAVGPLDDDVEVVLREGSATRTAEDGSFELDVPEAGTYALVAVDAGGVAAARLVSVPSPGEVELRVEPGFFHRPGRVVTDVGEKPVAGARVEAVDPRTQIVLARATTDEEGRFLLFVPPGESVRATAPGFAPAVQRVWYDLDVGETLKRLASRLFGGKEEKPQEIVVRLSVGASVSGRVRDREAKPVPGLTVTVLPHDTSDSFDTTARLEAETGSSTSDGAYEIHDAPAGSVLVSARGGGWITQGRPGPDGLLYVFARVAPGGTTVVDLTVVRTGSLAGRVLDEGGRAAKGARIEMTDERTAGRFRRSTEAPREALADAEGRFGFAELEPDATYVVRATRPDDPLVMGEAAVVGRADVAVPVEVVLRRGRRLTVVVTAREDGRPLADVNVRIDSPTGEPLKLRTDAAGRAVFEPLFPGARTVAAQTPGRLPLQAEVPGPPADTLTLPLVQGVTVRGRVVSPNGTAAGNVPVHCFTSVSNGSAVTDAQGRFVFEGQAVGVVEVQANVDGYTGFVRGTTGDDFEVRLSEIPPAVRVPVRVIGVDGAPRPSAVVRILDEWSANEVEGGAAEIPAGSWALATDGEAIALEGPFRGTEREVVLRLAPALSVEGVVRDETGRAVSGAALEARPADKEVRLPGVVAPRATSAADGSFRLHPLAPIEVSIGVQGPPDTSHVAPVVARAGSTGVVVVLPRGRTVRGVVVDAAGAPAARARVWLAPAVHGWDSWEQVDSDAGGRFRVERAPIGPFAVRAGRATTGPSEAAASETTVPAGVEEVTLTLPSTGTILVRVLGLRDGEQPSGRLSAQGEDGNRPARMVQPLGDLFRFEDVAAGKYSFWVGSLPDGRYALARDLQPGAGEHRLTLATGGSVRGTLRGFDPEQRAFALIPGPGVHVWGFVDGEGKFTVEGLPPGEWTVEVHQHGKEPDMFGTGRVATGGEVEIELRPR